MPSIACRYFGRILTSISITVLLIIAASCSSEYGSHIHVILSPSESLSDTDAGWWLKELGISKQEQGGHPTSKANSALIYRVRQALEMQGHLHDQYLEGKNTSVKEYIISVKRPRHGPRELLIKQRQTGVDDASLWFEVLLPPEGIPWIYLLSYHLASDQISSDDYDQFIASKSHGDKNVITIESPGEKGGRLLLYGPGAYCKRVVLD